MSYLDRNGNYYEGDLQPGDTVVTKRPSSNHDWDGNDWILDLAKYKAVALEVVKNAAKLKHDDFGNNLTKSDFITALGPFKTSFTSAADESAVDTVQTDALAAIEAL